MRIAEAAPFPGDSGQHSVIWSRAACAAAAPFVTRALGLCWPAPALLVRIGPPPRRGRSRNYKDGHCEAGVSVYRGELKDGRLDILAAGLDLKSTRAKFARARLHGTALFRCAGICLACGTDGEPVLRLARIEPLDAEEIARIRILARHPRRREAAHRRLWRRAQRCCAA